MVYKIGNEEVEAIKEVMRYSKFDRYIDGDNSITTRFEREFSEKIGTNYSLAVSSGTAALICGLAAMEIGPGDEVIIPSYTYIATALAVLAVGAIPIIAEIDESLTIDPTDISSKITTRTKAIIPVHMRGLPCNMSDILQIAKQYKLLILEDSAQACGGSYKGVRLGALGDAGMFSFNHYKNITCGEGGALVTNNLKIYQRAIIQHHGGYIYEIDAPNFQIDSFAGWNFRLSEIQSAMLRVQLTRLDGILEALRTEKDFILSRIEENSQALKANLIYDKKGDCGSNVFFIFRTSEQAKKFIEITTAEDIDVWCAYTKGHVYSEWEPILRGKGAHHPLRNPLSNQKVSSFYSTDMCPRTLDILNRTIGISTKIDRPSFVLEELVQRLIKTANYVR